MRFSWHVLLVTLSFLLFCRLQLFLLINWKSHFVQTVQYGFFDLDSQISHAKIDIHPST